MEVVEEGLSKRGVAVFGVGGVGGAAPEAPLPRPSPTCPHLSAADISVLHPLTRPAYLQHHVAHGHDHAASEVRVFPHGRLHGCAPAHDDHPGGLDERLEGIAGQGVDEVDVVVNGQPASQAAAGLEDINPGSGPCSGR